MPPKAALVIPTLDEAANVEALVRAALLSPGAGDWIAEVVVADSGSRDRTVEIARAAGARVLTDIPRGYGRACHEGAKAVSPDIEIITFLDGDGSDNPASLPLVIGPIQDGRADFVIGSRTRGEREAGSMNLLQVWSGHGIGLALWALYGVRYTDMSPVRAIRRTALEALAMREMTYGWNLEMQMRAARNGLRVLEVAVPHRRRGGGVSKVSGTVRGTVKAGARILSTLARIALEPKPTTR